MKSDNENPSQAVIDEMAAQGLSQDSKDPNRFVDSKGTVGAYGDGDGYYDGKSYNTVR